MQTFYGVWSPSQGKLPNVEKYDFAAYYIIESGSLNNVTYTKDKWLIYICESKGTLSERSYWRISDGIVVFNQDSHTNVPNPGFYTKIRLDNSGNIVAASNIEYDDLPKELIHKLKHIEDENLNKLITNQLKDFFVNNTLNPIQFKFDSKTGKISASLKLDENTINVNEYGQLFSNSSTSSDSCIDISIFTSEIAEINKKISNLEQNFIKIQPIQGKGIKLTASKGGIVFSVDIDENSLSFDRNGKLSVNPDILSDLVNEGGGNNCANHVHNVEQIEGIEDLVKDIINNVSIMDTLKSNIENLVDGSTIIINEDGKLTSIATEVQKHQHVMDDITDLNQEIADTWASQQRLHASNNNQDFNKGAVTMSTLTIGEVLIAFNQLFKEYKEDIDSLSNKIGTVQPAEPDYIDIATFENANSSINVIEVETLKEVSAYPKLRIKTNNVIYYNSTYVHCYIDDVLVETLKTYDSDDHSFNTGKYGGFYVTYFGDAYPDIKTFQGYYKGFSFIYEKELEEGTHKIYFVQEDTSNNKTYKSSDIYVNIYKSPKECKSEIIILSQPEYDSYVSGIKVNTKKTDITYAVRVKNFSSKYAPVDGLKTSVDGFGDFILSPYEYSNGFLMYGPQSVDVGNYYGFVTIRAEAKTLSGILGNSIASSNFINYDDSSEESYRVITSGTMIPTPGEISIVSNYDKEDSLVNDLLNEAQVIDHMLTLGKSDYSIYDLGDDYSIKPLQQSIVLRFPCNKINNFYFDIYDDENNSYLLKKDGTLQSIDIYASISTYGVISSWINCNSPYQGYGHWDSNNFFNGLDLFRSSNIRRYVTLGKDPIVNGEYLYIKLIISKPVNLSKFILSVEESLNERK